MHSDPCSPQPADETVPSLEDLLSLQTHQSAQAQSPILPSQGGTTAVKAGLLLALTSPSSDALLFAWTQRVLGGQLPHAARAEDALAQVQALRPQAILIEFDHGTLSIAVSLATQLQALHPEVIRVAVNRDRNPECMLAALRAGVHDFLDVDAPITTTQEMVRGLLKRRVQDATQAAHQPAPQLAIISARAGLGCSVLATHLAWYLHQALTVPAMPRSVAGTAQNTHDDDALGCLLVEPGGAESAGGDCAIYLNTPGEFSLTDAVAQQRRMDRRMAQTALARHDSGLRLLPQSRQGQPLAQGEAQALMMRLGQYFRHIVLDLGAHTPPALQGELLANASNIWVICDQNVVSVVWTMALLSQLESLHIERERLHLIVNRHDSRLALDAQQIAARLQLPLLATLPERRRELADAINHGKMLAPTQKSDPYVRALDKLVALLLQEHHSTAREHQPSAGALTQLLQRIRRS